MPLLEHPILIVSVNDDTRTALAASLKQYDLVLVSCATFLEAENLALKGLYSGILVDLPSIVKAKGEEKIVACSLTGFFPTLRVRVMGPMLIPMTMPGAAKQESSVGDFINRACKQFAPRQLRSHHRHAIGISVATRFADTETRAFTLDISWGGAFIVDFNPERFEIGDELTVFIQEPGCEVQARVCWKQSWGQRHAPGIGVHFLAMSDYLSEFMLRLLKHAKDHDRDRLVA